ncbi:unnamed protein product [Fusarium graminearum]|nr:unnamed protein product [Fusarium graminearum]
MDLSIPSGYESYSNRLDPHDEVDNGHAEKAARLSSDEQTLLKQRRAPPKPKGGALDTIRLALRVLILLVNLSILGLLAHGVNVWQATHSSIDRNDDGWVRTRWPSIKMLSTWLMLAVTIFASVVQLVALATRLSFLRSMRDGVVHNVTVFVSSGIVIAGWIAATVYLIVDKEVLQNNHWDLWSWSCQNRSRQSYIPWASLCTEMTYAFAASLSVILLEIVTLVLFVVSMRGMNILGKSLSESWNQKRKQHRHNATLHFTRGVRHHTAEKKAKYCRLADTQQWDKFDSIMLPNATYSFHEPDGSVITQNGVTYAWSSLADWAAFFNNANKDLQAIHNIGPAEMEQISPDEIKASWSVIYHVGNKEPDSGAHGTRGGYYHETWRKVGDDWFMETLRMDRLYWKLVTH